MKLKPVVASLVMLGLTAPAFAHSSKTMVLQQAVVDQNSVISTVCPDGWFNRITLGGRGSVVGIVGNHDLPGSFTTLNTGTDLYVNDVNLLVNANLCCWSKFTLNLAYLGAPSYWFMDSSSMLESNPLKVPVSVEHRIFADEAYLTFADFAKYPVYFKVGKTFIPFGEYTDQHIPISIMSPAQMLAEINAPAAILGVASDFGLYASAFGFKGDTFPSGVTTNNIRNWGAKVGYHDNLGAFEAPNTHFNINLSYVHNVWDSLVFTSNSKSPYKLLNLRANASSEPRDEVGGIAGHLDVTYKAFSAYADFVGALKDMHKAYFPSIPATTFDGSSKFWGANVNAAYAFETMSHDSSLGVGVQFSGNGQWFATAQAVKDVNSGLFSAVIPKWRALVEYQVNLCKHTDLDLVFAHGKSYDIPTIVPAVVVDQRTVTAATTTFKARSTNVGLARLAFRF